MVDKSEDSDLLENSFNFDQIWRKLPEVSSYQMLLICLLAATVGGANGLVVIWPIFGQFTPDFQCTEPTLPNKTCSLLDGQTCSSFIYERESFNSRHTWRNDSQIWNSGKTSKRTQYNFQISRNGVRSGLFPREALSNYDFIGNGRHVYRSCFS